MRNSLIEKSRVEWTGDCRSHHDPVSSDVSSGAQVNELHASIFRTIGNCDYHSGTAINLQEQARPDRKAQIEKITPTYLGLDFNIFYNRGSPMKPRYGMKGASGFTPLSESLRMRLQELVLLGFTKSERTNLKLNPKRLRNSPSFVEKFLNQVDMQSFWQNFA